MFRVPVLPRKDGEYMWWSGGWLSGDSLCGGGGECGFVDRRGGRGRPGGALSGKVLRGVGMSLFIGQLAG